MENTPATVAPLESTFCQDINHRLRAGYSILHVPTAEEARTEDDLLKVAHFNGMAVCTWDMFEGFQPLRGRNDAAMDEGSHPAGDLINASPPIVDPFQALERLKNLKGDCMYIFRDLIELLPQFPRLRRALRSYGSRNRLMVKNNRRLVVLLSPHMELDQRLRHVTTTIEYDLPTEADMQRCVKFIVTSAQSAKSGKSPAQVSDEIKERLAQSLLGLTHMEAENILSLGAVTHGQLTQDTLKLIKDEKATIIRKGEVLTYVDEATIADTSELGGFENFIQFIDRRTKAYDKAARAANIDYPKGVILVGPPGTAKSVAGLATGKRLKLPVFTLDVGAVFGSLVGESEARLRGALRQISAQQGCVLMIDEADKALGGAASATGDSGVTRRVFGQLLSWLANKRDRTFVIMTMNRTDGIPPEFMRAGRFDAVFYTDLPSPEQRKEILDIQLRKRHIDPATLDAELVNTVVENTDQFVGAEIEQALIEARNFAWAERQTGMPNAKDFTRGIANVTPVARLDSDSVKSITDWCTKNGAKPVAGPSRKQVTPPRRAIVTNDN